MRASFRLGRIFGIEIGVHYTWVFAFAFIAWSIAEGFFPDLYRDWSRALYWGTGMLAALLLFGSVLVHELAHSLVALAKGLPATSITLFIFGGVSNLGAEARRARDEFIVAVVGPLSSLVLAGLFWALVQTVGDASEPLEAILLYLAIVNTLLAVFNMLPGFPLDGGHVLRSILWGVTGNLARATNVAATVGQLFGWVLVGLGVFQVLRGDLLSGLWVAFVGWFLKSAADGARRQTALEEILRDIPVRAVMDPRPETIGPETTVESLVRDWVLQRGVRALPVCEGERLVGIVTVTDARGVPEERWPFVRVGEIMVRDPIHSVSPESVLSEALRLLADHNVHQIVVLRDGMLAGLLSRADMMRHLRLLQELRGGPDADAAS